MPFSFEGLCLVPNRAGRRLPVRDTPMEMGRKFLRSHTDCGSGFQLLNSMTGHQVLASQCWHWEVQGGGINQYR